jgi:hypothetical protein
MGIAKNGTIFSKNRSFEKTKKIAGKGKKKPMVWVT